MMRRSTWIVLGVAVVLLAATLFWQRTRSNLETSTEATPASNEPKLEFGFAGAQVIEIVIQDSEGATVVLDRNADGFWELEQPEAEMTNSQTVENALSQLLAVNTVSRISSQTALSDLGLDPPAYRLLLRLDDGSEMVINVGKVTPTGSGYYVLTSSEDRALYVVGKYNLEMILNLIQIPPIMTPTPTSESPPQATATP
jgi:hypothetical protein